MAEHSSATAAPAMAVVLLQPARVGGKRHPVGATLTLPLDQAESLFASGSAEPAATEASTQQPPEAGAEAGTEAKPAGKRAPSKAKAAE